MFSRWILLTCLFTAPLFADTIGEVEYQLPESGWKKVDEMKNDKSTTYIYLPENTEAESVKEFFSAHTNSIKTEEIDPSKLEQELKKNFPENEVKVTILEKNPQSVLFEWKVMEQGKEMLHGWTRLFLDAKGTTILSYQTEEIQNMDKKSELWLSILKGAHVP